MGWTNLLMMRFARASCRGGLCRVSRLIGWGLCASFLHRKPTGSQGYGDVLATRDVFNELYKYMKMRKIESLKDA